MGNTYFEHIKFEVHKGGKGPRRSGSKEHDRAGAGEEGYAELWA